MADQRCWLTKATMYDVAKIENAPGNLICAHPCRLLGHDVKFDHRIGLVKTTVTSHQGRNQPDYCVGSADIDRPLS